MSKMSDESEPHQGTFRLTAVGDVQPNREDPGSLFSLVDPFLKPGDLRICQLEATLSTKGIVRTDVQNPAHRVHPRNIEALTAVNFNVVTMAGNNNIDYGLEAFYDTIDLCREHGIAVAGAGHNLAEACEPVQLEAAGRRVAFLSFCSILREGYAATPSRGGIAPLHVSTFYEPLENIYEQPGTPAKTVTVVDQPDLQRVLEKIREARERADIVVASFHWGVHFTHDLAMYQPDVAYAAIDAGADVVLGTHPHCLQAIDVYKGKPIFYSLGNFAFEQPEPIAQHGVSKYLSFYGLEVDRSLAAHPHPWHCRLTMIVQLSFKESGVSEIRLVPVYFNDDAQPEPLKAGTTLHSRVVELLEGLCNEIGTEVVRDGDDVIVRLEKVRDVDTRDWVRQRAMSYPWLGRIVTSQLASSDLQQNSPT
jgi:poly-gamma-glutamate synthesis protein (capsule biosynthesis protein)